MENVEKSLDQVLVKSKVIGLEKCWSLGLIVVKKLG